MQSSRRQFGKAILAAGGASVFSHLGFAQEEQWTGSNSLRAHAAAHGLMYGAAARPEFMDVEGFAAGTTTDPYTRLLAEQCNIIVPETALKWNVLRPAPDKFDFAPADKVMRFAELAHQRVRGHNLCWYAFLPGWFEKTANKENARTLLTDHINTVAGRYRGKIHSWDVVNEAIDPKSSRQDGLRKSLWLDLIGPDYIDLAFTTAAQADPKAKLTYNDFGFELDTPDDNAKRAKILALVKGLKARGVPIHAVGIQSHFLAPQPMPGGGLIKFIRELRSMGLEAYVTEMDINAARYPGGPEEMDSGVAKGYRDYLRLVLAEPNVPLVMTWGITSAHTYINIIKQAWLMRLDGVPQRPLPFDDAYRPTPAFFAMRNAFDSTSRS